MRNRAIILLLMIAGIAAVGGTNAGTEQNRKPSLDLQVEQLIGSLREQIIPPAGTPKAEVDKVYGEPEEIREKHPGKGSSHDYPMHTYQLLDPPAKLDFRAVLYITYRDGRVYRAGVNHIAVVKNGLAGASSTGAQRETRYVLVDLLEIYNKHDVAAASWNASAAGR